MKVSYSKFNSSGISIAFLNVKKSNDCFIRVIRIACLFENSFKPLLAQKLFIVLVTFSADSNLPNFVRFRGSSQTLVLDATMS